MKNVDWKDVGIRAAKTFLEAAAAFLIAEITGTELFSIGGQMWGAIGLSAVAAGVSAVWNGVIEPLIAPVVSDKSDVQKGIGNSI